MAQTAIAQDNAQDNAKRARSSVEYVKKVAVHGDHHKKADAFVTGTTLPPIDPEAEKALNRKLDIWVMPLLTLNFLFAYVDR